MSYFKCVDETVVNGIVWCVYERSFDGCVYRLSWGDVEIVNSFDEKPACESYDPEPECIRPDWRSLDDCEDCCFKYGCRERDRKCYEDQENRAYERYYRQYREDHWDQCYDWPSLPVD